MAEDNEERKLEPFVRHGTEENQVEVSANEILNAIAEGRDIDIEWAVIEGDLDIEKIRDGLDEEDGRSVVRCNVKIWYGAIKGKTGFRQARFSGDAYFFTSFSGDADFDGATFSGNAYFTEVMFSGDADFVGATFSGDANFVGATFSGNADFDGAAFSGNAYFTEVTFSGDATFSVATFSGSAYFFRARFSGDANFMQAHMEWPANFAGVCFKENKVLVGLWNNVFRPIFRFVLKPVLWAISQLRGTTTDLPEKLVTDFRGFNTTTMMDASSNPYLKRYIDDEQWIASWKERGRAHKLLFFLWELTSHCGRSIGLWVMWSVFVAVILFGGILYGIYEDHLVYRQDIELWANHPLAASIYFSIVTFTTLGFGDVTAKTLLGAIVVGAEVVVGYIMLGVLISIFANKLARRA